MNGLAIRNFVIVLISALVWLPACQKEKNADCFFPDYIVVQSYEFPIWHPNGTLLGFNHTPLQPIELVGQAPCSRYSYLGNFDSTGFYVMNKDKTAFKRETRFRLETPAWSPDGKWIAFVLGQNIYKMPFNGTGLDTTQMIQLTTDANNYSPSWTANSDTIYYTSDVSAPAGTGLSEMWKMSGNGTGKTKITNATTTTDNVRDVFVGSDNRIYHTRMVEPRNAPRVDIFSMSKDGADLLRLTTNTNDKTRQFARYWQGKIYYQSEDGIYAFTPGSQPTRIINETVRTFDISSNGDLVYSRFNNLPNVKDEQLGTLWTTNSDGKNKQQLTFNRF